MKTYLIYENTARHTLWTASKIGLLILVYRLVISRPN